MQYKGINQEYFEVNLIDFQIDFLIVAELEVAYS